MYVDWFQLLFLDWYCIHVILGGIQRWNTMFMNRIKSIQEICGSLDYISTGRRYSPLNCWHWQKKKKSNNLATWQKNIFKNNQWIRFFFNSTWLHVTSSLVRKHWNHNRLLKLYLYISDDRMISTYIPVEVYNIPAGVYKFVKSLTEKLG